MKYRNRNCSSRSTVCNPTRRRYQTLGYPLTLPRQARMVIMLLLAIAMIAPTGVVADTRNGQLDPTFGNGGIQVVDFGVASFSDGLDITPDGRIVLGCTVAGAVDYADFGVARLLADGSIDIGFSWDGRAVVEMSSGDGYDDVTSVVAQADGKVVAIGTAPVDEVPPSPYHFALARFNSDGTLDESFNGDGKAFIDFDASPTLGAVANDGALLPDGKMIVVGLARTEQDGDEIAVAKLNVDGSRDTSFDDDGVLTMHFELGVHAQDEDAQAVAIDNTGRIVIGARVQTGGFGSYSHDFAVVRLLPDGHLDPSFGNYGRAVIAFDIGGDFDDQVRDIVVAPDDSIFLVGFATGSNWDGAVARLLADGSLDTSFGGDGRVSVPFDLGDHNHDLFYAAALQPDGALVLAGQADSAAGGDMVFARLLPDGSLDPNFGFAGKSVLALDLGGTLLDTAYELQYSAGAMVFSGKIDTGSNLRPLVGRVVIEDLFTDGFE